MKNKVLSLMMLFPIWLLCQTDREGKDYSGITRMKGYYIGNYLQEKESYYDFAFGKKEKRIEGDFYEITYYLKENLPKPGTDTIMDYYKRVISSLGGQIVFAENDILTGVVYNPTGELWIGLTVWNDVKHTLYIISQQKINQLIDLTKEEIERQISSAGKVVLRSVSFAEDSSEISNYTAEKLEVIASYLLANKGGKFCLVSHTSTTGDAEYNLRLSEKRAAALVTYLINKYNIDEKKLTSKGLGFYSPITTNETSQGKKTNERIELVKL